LWVQIKQLWLKSLKLRPLCLQSICTFKRGFRHFSEELKSLHTNSHKRSSVSEFAEKSLDIVDASSCVLSLLQPKLHLYSMSELSNEIVSEIIWRRLAESSLQVFWTRTFFIFIKTCTRLSSLCSFSFEQIIQISTAFLCQWEFWMLNLNACADLYKRPLITFFLTVN